MSLEHICRFFLINPPEHLSLENHCVNHYAQINIYINALYIDIAGVLDNLAWCMIEHFEISITNPFNISLFKDELFKSKSLKNLQNLKSDLACYEEWYKDFKKRRNPVAHRIPLYVPIPKTDSLLSVKPLLKTYFENEKESWNLWECLARDLSHLTQIIDLVFKYLKEK